MSEEQCSEHDAHEAYTNCHNPPPKVEPTVPLREETSWMPQTEQKILDAVEPELHCSHEGIAHEQHKESVVVDSDTVLRPYTVVVHLVDTTTAAGAVRYPRKLKVVALGALFSS